MEEKYAKQVSLEQKLDDVEKKYKNEKENGEIKGKELGNQEKKVQVC